MMNNATTTLWHLPAVDFGYSLTSLQQTHYTTYISSASKWQLYVPVFCIYMLGLLLRTGFNSKTPLATAKSHFVPSIIQNYRFFKDAESILRDAFSKSKDQVFQVTRIDTKMLVLPPKYIEELRTLPSSVASPTVAHAHNLMGRHTNMNIILKNDLHFRTLQTKLTPNLGSLNGPMQDELDFAVAKELPACKEDWVPIQPYHSVLRLVARISARIFLGLPVCRNEEWLEISTEFTENVFVSLVVLRLFPMFTHYPLSYLLPSAWRGARYIRRAQKLLVPEIQRRRKAAADAKDGPKERNDLLSWMMDIANEEESDAAALAHLEVVMSLASIHTSQMNAVHVLYDLAAYPEYIEMLRKEIQDAVKKGGPWKSWKKSTYSRLSKLDSFMRESQRVNPPTLLAMHRVFLETHVFEDGYTVPRGTHVSMAVNAIQNSITSDPDTFDGLRYYKMRQRPRERHRHQFSTTEEYILNFGHGKHACPGRFFASLEIKNILVRLIMDYDFKLSDGQGRPKNLAAHDYVFPDPDAQLLIRERPASERLVHG